MYAPSPSTEKNSITHTLKAVNTLGLSTTEALQGPQRLSKHNTLLDAEFNLCIICLFALQQHGHSMPGCSPWSSRRAHENS